MAKQTAQQKAELAAQVLAFEAAKEAAAKEAARLDYEAKLADAEMRATSESFQPAPLPALRPTGLRGGRIAPLKGGVLTALRAGARTVASLAEEFAVAERDVRLAIDALRAKGYRDQLKRVALNTFQVVE